ncbi:MAG: hypothetical protein UY35_C0020G0012 [Candidatus Saccharibacteria bacterium GW2011_GWC2_48_9]|nr:MAG: hypothetical protein UY35_C0020G0012 [Candidatus Saccharibacteria bacterium GW2011_GWC2_48_9]
MSEYSCRGSAAPFTFAAQDPWASMEALASLENKRRNTAQKLAIEAINTANDEQGGNDDE